MSEESAELELLKVINEKVDVLNKTMAEHVFPKINKHAVILERHRVYFLGILAFIGAAAWLIEVFKK